MIRTVELLVCRILLVGTRIQSGAALQKARKSVKKKGINEAGAIPRNIIQPVIPGKIPSDIDRRKNKGVGA